MVLTMSARQFSLVPHRSVIAVGGPDRIEFPQGLISNDTDQGGARAGDLGGVAHPTGPPSTTCSWPTAAADTLLLETEREAPQALARKLGLYKLRSKATVEDRGAAMECRRRLRPRRRQSRRSEGTPSPSSIRGLPTSACACWHRRVQAAAAGCVRLCSANPEAYDARA